MKTVEEIRIIPSWSKSREDIWNERFADIVEIAPMKRGFLKRYSLVLYVAAAVAGIVFVLSGGAFLYTKTEFVSRGMQATVVLPDHSTVRLNSESELRYKPYWWFASRRVELRGEAFFEVEPGSRFEVGSGGHTVSVSGTSFNVFARSEVYVVTCLTGRVRVSGDNQSVELLPDMQAAFAGKGNGELTARRVEDVSRFIGWTQNRFVFVTVPLREVIEEIERQYDIRVICPENLDYLYTGNFSKTKDPKEVLRIVGRPFGIEFKIKYE